MFRSVEFGESKFAKGGLGEAVYFKNAECVIRGIKGQVFCFFSRICEEAAFIPEFIRFRIYFDAICKVKEDFLKISSVFVPRFFK